MSIDSTAVEGLLRLSDGAIVDQHINSAAAIQRSKLEQSVLSPFPIMQTEWRVWDSLVALLPVTSSSDDLGLYPGSWGTTPWLIRTSDLKAAGSVTRYAACEVRIPAEYDAGQTITLRARAGMITTVADTAATIDFEVYCKTGDGATLTSDLCATSATTINSTSFANKDFTITPTSRVAGDLLQIRMAILTNDAATVTAVISAVESVKLLFDIRG